MRKPFRVAVWGPGVVGSAVLKEFLRLPEFEVVGVFCYLDSEDGRDVGELVGMPPIGVKATKDRTEFLAQDIECVVYTARDFGDWAADSDLIEILSAGKNVVTSFPYNYPKVIRSREAVDKLETACREGNSTLFASGVFPGFIAEHIMMAMTTAVDNIKHIRIQEIYDGSDLNAPEMLAAYGWGSPMEQTGNTRSPVYIMTRNFYFQLLHLLADKFGIVFDRIEGIPKSEPAGEDMQAGGLLIKKGTVAAVSYAWTGYIKDKPFLTLEPHWYMGKSMRPPEATAEECWIITIEGTPSLKAVLSAKGSFEFNRRRNPGDNTDPGYYMTAVPMVRSIPSVIAAKPGIKIVDVDDQHWKPDLRT